MCHEHGDQGNPRHNHYQSGHDCGCMVLGCRTCCSFLISNYYDLYTLYYQQINLIYLILALPQTYITLFQFICIQLNFEYFHFNNIYIRRLNKIMSIKNIQQSIKLSMNIINKALKQIPAQKKPLITSKVNAVLNKYVKTSTTQQQMRKFQKQLQFNLNFIKLSHPNLDYTITSEEVQQQFKKQKSDSKNQKQHKHKVKLQNNQQFQIQRLDAQDTFDTQLQKQKGAREQVQFSNWFDGNVDPQKLKKHKQLLERQHFHGQFWKGKEKPHSFAKQYLKSAMAATAEGEHMPKKDKVLQDFTPKNIDESNQVWEKVKR